MIEIPVNPRFHANQEKAGDLPPCIVCGKGIKAENPKMVHVHNGGTHLVTEEEAAQMDPAADLYFYPIGNECLRKYPDLRPYIHGPTRKGGA